MTENIDLRAALKKVDEHVGGRLRHHRLICRMSQQDLGASLGVTFQQVQKYERAANRISASRLLVASQTLEITVASFFDGLNGASDTRLHMLQDQLLDAEDRHTFEGFLKLRRNQRQSISALIVTMAQS